MNLNLAPLPSILLCSSTYIHCSSLVGVYFAQVYSSVNPCKYKDNTYFNISLLLGDTPIQTEVASINDSTSCANSACLVQFPSLPLLGASEDIQVSIVVGNRFGETRASTFGSNTFCKWLVSRTCMYVCMLLHDSMHEYVYLGST